MEEKQTLNDIQKYQGEYNEEGLWDKVLAVCKKAGIKVIYLVLVLYYALQSEHTTAAQKSIIYGALGYFILPLDLIPDALPVVGFADDFTALVACVRALHACITPAVLTQADSKLHEWFKDYDKNEIKGLVDDDKA